MTGFSKKAGFLKLTLLTAGLGMAASGAVLGRDGGTPATSSPPLSAPR
jgi:hypothetical protein